MSGRSVNLTTLFLGRLRPPKRLTSTSCTYFRQSLTTALLEKAEGETKDVARPGIEPVPLTYESGALPIALRGPACLNEHKMQNYFEEVITHLERPLDALHFCMKFILISLRRTNG